MDTKYIQRDTDGSVDVAASAGAYARDLTKWVAENEIPSDTIETAVEAVFDRFPGTRLSMPSLLGFTVVELGATPEQHKTLTNRAHAYVSGQSALNTGRLDIAKGKNGGVLRLAKPGQAIPARTKKSA